MTTQLTIDGREVPYPLPTIRPLTAGQRAIMAWARSRGFIRSSEAGVAIHASHPGPAGNWCGRPLRASALGCCEYAASAGGAACQRLAARGLLRRQARGYWVPVWGDDGGQ